MNKLTQIRVAWLLPLMGPRAMYWQPVLREFKIIMPQTVVFTGLWSGYTPSCKDSFRVKVVGKTRLIPTGRSSCITFPSLSVLGDLVRFKPDVVFTAGFNVWTVFALLLGLWNGLRVVVIYDGSSPNVDKNNSIVRLFVRRLMVRLANAFITNSYAGKTYLQAILNARESCVFARPYQVPDKETLLASTKDHPDLFLSDTQRPLFLFVGEIIPGKGLHFLLQACSLLQKKGWQSWTLLVVGDGAQRSQLEDYVKNHGLNDRIRWAGWVSYSELGSFFQRSDVFVFPTLEDIWGMVLLEAMAFGKPVICSNRAGAAEMVSHAENGYIVDPYQADEIANRMKDFIDKPQLIHCMGERSKQIVAGHTPTSVARHLSDVVAAVINKHEH
jgi:glycosyltransferase involved in cell wall biosynthesis